MTLTTETATGTSDAPEMVLVQVRVAAIAEHPRNPRKQLKGIDEMAASMRTNGLLQPVVVVPIAAFLAATETETGGVRIQPAAGTEYVVVIGHRRCAAAEQLAWETIAAIVRPDLASARAAARTFIVENSQRVDLDPIEEATGYADLVALGLSQRAIADEVGKSQAHVSKRLALLQLPDAARDAVSKGEVKLADAVKLAALPAEVQDKAWEIFTDDPDLADAVQAVEAELEAEVKVQAARQLAADEGLELIDPREAFGDHKHWNHQLYNADAIAKAKKAGTLRAHATPRGLEYYSTIPRESAGTDRASAEADRAKAMKRATKNRRSALEKLLAKPPTSGKLMAELAAAVVQGESGHFEALKLVMACLPARVSTGSGDVYSWRDGVADKDWPWVAWAMTVATTELSARTSYVTWGQRHAAYVQRLIDSAGYEPTDWETEQLHEIRRADSSRQAAS